MEYSHFLIDKLLIVAKDHHITARMLSKKTGIHPQTISGWRRGRYSPSLENYVKLIVAMRDLDKEAFSDLHYMLNAFALRFE